MSATPVTEIKTPQELPTVKMRMESAPTIETAQAWAEKIQRPVYWYKKNHTAYAPLVVEPT